jgi:type IV secretory pathway VirB10-like protein
MAQACSYCKQDMAEGSYTHKCSAAGCENVMHSWATETCGTVLMGVYNRDAKYFCPAHIPEVKAQKEAFAKMKAAGHHVQGERSSPRKETSAAAAAGHHVRKLNAVEKAEEAAKRPRQNPFKSMMGKRSMAAANSTDEPQRAAEAAAIAVVEKDLPQMAGMERDRKMKKKVEPPKGVRGRQHAARSTPEPKIPAITRVNEFPNQSFRVQFGDLFCGCCKTVLSKIKGTIKTHIESDLHKHNAAIQPKGSRLNKLLGYKFCFKIWVKSGLYIENFQKGIWAI